MILNDLPTADVIRKFTKKIDKNGAPAASEGKLSSQWMDITPAMAADWLKNNFRNRPMDDYTVAAYARDMVSGAWQPTHQGIAFNDGDQLIDGQHRLAAIIKSRKTVRMMVTFGLPSKIDGHEATVMDCVDRGRTRSVADQLKIQHGLKNGTQVAQIAPALGHLCFGEALRKLTVSQTLVIYREFKAAADLCIANRSKEHGLRAAGVYAAFAFVMASVTLDPTKGEVYKMLLYLNSGDSEFRYPMIQKLRAFLTGENASMIIASMNKGIAELVVHVIYCEVREIKSDALEMNPAKWLEAVMYFRQLQAERVRKIASLFHLEKDSTAIVPEAVAPGPDKKRKLCECGEPAITKSRGMWTCQKCLNLDAKRRGIS